jgi:putative methylase
LEQYSITGNLASEILNLAHLHGDIEDKIVFDHGCGTGRLAIGAAILGAKEVVGVDIDKSSISMAKENLKRHDIYTEKKLPVHFVICDLNNWHAECDTVVQNPPFGIKALHADRLFLTKAMECGKRVYSLHKDGLKKTQDFLTSLAEKSGGKVMQIFKFKFEIPYMFKFHRKQKVTYNVDLYIIEKVK